MDGKKLFRNLKQANLKYEMIRSGDRIAVGVSGGKDSLILLYSLNLLMRFSPLRFEVVPITVDPGWGDSWQGISEYCSSFGWSHNIVNTSIGPLVFQERQETNPCALCSNLRSGALHKEARRLGCNRLALGHHLDDAVVTLMMSMMFEGQYRTFLPVTYLSRSQLTLIRPMIYVDEEDILEMTAALDLPVMNSSCPASGSTNRERVANTLRQIEQEFPGSKRRMLRSMENVNAKFFWNGEHLF